MPETPITTNRQLAKELWSHGIRNSAEISQHTGIPKRSCERYIGLLQKTGNIPAIHRLGCPRILSPRKRRHVGLLIKGNHFRTAGEIKAKLEETHQELSVNERTIRREISRMGYKAILPRRVPLLTQHAKEVHLQWAKDHQTYAWKNVVFSDETTLQMFRNTCLAWSQGGTPITPMVKHPFKLHVWAAISMQGKIGFYSFTQNMDRHLYRKILNENLYENATTKHQKRWIFQQDNDPKHTSKDVKEDLNIQLPRRVLPWPSYSPDLNPIENIWALLKHQVEKKVKAMVAWKEKVAQDAFIAVVKKEWDEIPIAAILSSIKSMPDRVQACISAEGGHTKY
jgi:DDE superfamily endonuclease/Transposase